MVKLHHANNYPNFAIYMDIYLWGTLLDHNAIIQHLLMCKQ